MRFSLLLITPVFLLMLASCKDKNKSNYDGCCGTEATVDSVEIMVQLYNENNIKVDSLVKARIFIPNVFTPDSVYYENGIFLIFGEYVARVVSAKYFSESGEKLFEHNNFQVYDTGAAWQGKKFNGDFYYGLFDYEVEIVLLNGEIKTYLGQACSYKCGAAGFPAEKLPNCLFPSQNNGYGSPDPSRPVPGECF